MSELTVSDTPKEVCEECGSDGKGGMIEYSNGVVAHFRDISAWKDGKVHHILCTGKFIRMVKEGRGER